MEDIKYNDIVDASIVLNISFYFIFHLRLPFQLVFLCSLLLFFTRCCCISAFDVVAFYIVSFAIAIAN